jgi:LuxR family transcriptional regulator, maltose regulon positive regulatory protein
VIPVPLLETKFHAPRRRRGVVARPRLEARLDPAQLPALTLVSAPAGFGKTTLLAEWLASVGQDARVAWVSLDSRDNDPHLFCAYLVAAVRAVAGEVGDGAAAMLEDGASTMEGVLATLLNDLGRVETEVVVVLDDYHVVESGAVHASVRFLLENLPAHGHLVLATRADPPWPLAGLRARGELLELRAADLRFTAEEAVAYLNGAMDLTLSDAEVETLEVRTEGWVAALQLAALSLQGRDDIAGFIAGFAGDDRFILDYLADEVLDQQSEEMRHFLLRTSILSRLTGPLCDAVTGQTTGKATLEALERANLFLTPLDDRRVWYRYHHLFADVLSARLLDEEPSLVAELHRRASGWHEHHGDAGEAIRHALDAKSFPRAAGLVELAVPAMRQARQEATLRSWFEALPPEVFVNRPVLRLGQVGARMASGDIDGVEAALAEVERCLDTTDARSGDLVVVDEAEFARLPAQTAMYRAALALLAGDLTGTIDHAGRVLDLTAEDDLLGRGAASALLGLARWTLGELSAAEDLYAESVGCFERAEHYADVLGCRRALADIQFARGSLGAALRTLESGLELARAHGPLRGTADMHAGLSELFRERNDLTAARTHVHASAELGDRLALPQNAYRWRVALARLLQIDGDWVGALDLLHEAEELYDTDYSPSIRPVPAVTARMQARGDLAAARRWATSRNLDPDGELSYLGEYEYLTLARLLLAEHHDDPSGTTLRDVLRLLHRLLDDAESGPRRGSTVEILALQALAHHAAADIPSALEALEAAQRRAEPEGYVRIFLDEGAPMAALLQTAVRQGRAVEWARRLLAAGPTAPTGASTADVRPSASGPVDALSRRELEVLRLLRSDLTGPEIARELMVSLNTVRTHTKNIYMKLGVTSRRGAVRRAAELGL